MIDFLSIGDTATDAFIKLKEAETHCDINKENCTICMGFGTKIPFESATIVAGVGNAANAAVSAARLGLSSALIANIGQDRNGDDVMTSFQKEKIDTSRVTRHSGIPTNYHYVLWYGDERTILIKHQDFPRVFPADIETPKVIYLTSLGAGTEKYHTEISAYLDAHPDIFVTFQPGTFHIKMGAEKLAVVYKQTNLLVLNKDEAREILKNPSEESSEVLAQTLQALGPKTVIITDGRNGVFALEKDGNSFTIPMYPDPKAPVERTGAGDAFASTTTAYLSIGYSLKDAMYRGTINSAYVVQEIGAQKGLLTKEKIEALAK